ncbi:MAG: hypothetical protein QM668_02505 [Agriterribacter sp.]
MKSKTLFLALSFILAITIIVRAQKINPYKEIGKKGEILTLTKGEFEEFFDQEDVQQIGTNLVNIRTMKIVKVMTDDEAEKKLDNTTGKRFLSIDPLTTKYPMLTPYQFASNTPIQSIDLDGLEEYHYILNFNKEGKPQLSYSKTVMEKTFLFWSYRPTETFVVNYKGESYEFSPAGYSTSPLSDWTANSYDKLTNWMEGGYEQKQFGQVFYSTYAKEMLNAGTYAESTTDDIFKGNAYAKLNAKSVNSGSKPSNNIKQSISAKETWMPKEGGSVGYSLENGKINLSNRSVTNGTFDFVVTDEGNLVIGSKHFALSGGAESVQAAGTLKIYKGKVMSIDNNSGHYKPNTNETKNFGQILKNAGVDVSGAKLNTLNSKGEKVGASVILE